MTKYLFMVVFTLAAHDLAASSDGVLLPPQIRMAVQVGHETSYFDTTDARYEAMAAKFPCLKKIRRSLTLLSKSDQHKLITTAKSLSPSTTSLQSGSQGQLFAEVRVVFTNGQLVDQQFDLSLTYGLNFKYLHGGNGNLKSCDIQGALAQLETALVKQKIDSKAWTQIVNK